MTGFTLMLMEKISIEFAATIKKKKNLCCVVEVRNLSSGGTMYRATNSKESNKNT